MGQAFFRVNTDLLPLTYPLSVEWTGNRVEEVSFYLQDGIVSLKPQEVEGVWARRLWPARFPPECPPELVEACAPAASTMVLDSLDLFRRAKWINPQLEGKRAESKLLQLSLAQELGLDDHTKLVTNHPEKVRDFFHRHRGDIVTKLLVPQVVQMVAQGGFAYTCKVELEHLDHLDQVRGMPQIFQPFISKVREYRVVVVGEKVFCGALPIPADGPLSVDWRQAGPEDGLEWEAAELPEPLVAKMFEMLDRLGLVFGVFDFAETPDGRLVFFEVNQAGEWGMLEDSLGFPIAQALAEELCR